MVTMDKRKELTIESVELEKSSGKTFKGNSVSRTLKHRISLTQMNEAANRIPQLVHWRFEVLDKGEAIAEKEGMIKSVNLPKDWYK